MDRKPTGRAGPKKVTVFVGSARRRGATSRAAGTFLEQLASRGDIQGEVVFLSDYDLGVCNGCKRCTNQGEECCPLKDDRDILIGKMMASDGVVFASPNYSFQVSAIMKIFLDRLAFVFHRPRFHGKTFSVIVVQGIGMGGRIVKYLEFVGGGLGFNVVKGSCSRTLEPMSRKARDRMERNLAEQSRRFHDRLQRPAFPTPSFLGLLMFRMARTGYRKALGEDMRDHVHFRDRGWFESDFYYPVRLGPFKKAAGALFDRAAARCFRPRTSDPGTHDLASPCGGTL
jgi:multimeric flavodoxin WrbA